MSNDKKALIALMDLVLALADYATTPPGHRGKAIDRVAAERREVAGWRETLHLLGTEANRQSLEASIRQSRLQQVVADGQAARTAVAATERRMRAWYGLEDREPIGVRPARWQLAQELKDLAGNPLDPHFGLEAYEGMEADDSRVTDGHKCCGGKPDCGCARSVGG